MTTATTTRTHPNYSKTHRIGGLDASPGFDLDTLVIGPVRLDERGRYTWTADWSWAAHTDSDGVHVPAGTGSLTLRTNHLGTGLWLVSDTPGREDKQLTGTCQLTLNGSPTTRRRHAVAAMLTTLGAEPVEQW